MLVAPFIIVPTLTFLAGPLLPGARAVCPEVAQRATVPETASQLHGRVLPGGQRSPEGATSTRQAVPSRQHQQAERVP